MAERRMFAKTIVESDAFIDMPLSSQALYFHYGMLADDEGFVNSPKKIQRMIGASEDDLKLLITKRFILPFESGIIVIKHWRMNNYIQKDRFKETVYQNEKSLLSLKENGSYTECIQDVSKKYTQDRLGKVSIGKDSVVVEGGGCADGFQAIIDYYDQNVAPVTEPVLSMFQSYMEDDKMECDLILEAIKIEIEENKKSMIRTPFKYIKAILNNWSKRGIKSVSEVKQKNDNTVSLEDIEKMLEEVK